ncbi:MAG: phospho-N-acetylmuramoyl-pentapeptide-transferase [Candidatus Kerfeldbacteria bacterium CG_4_10_14_0_8_um_filter_42_10]|uniref:Phospho-N-acetylmuramoyl-pentapeptide-transferase n=1 Tax=Candidatus Kerfeldbacteria bacterium CG_4_10_14_0_8_um_filter_42_10 TaxID=2014248 RepID=A0A2M7RL22_9BACT|nr:MAG: phospho-N-acetylmuramoyl-pentapeptide-transferase [Candidatus Kerfeldbacteria bacterium CG_4_10_14_0_8_um_filter_42_10]
MNFSVSFDIIKILFLGTVSFIISILLTPILTHFLYKYKLGKQIRSSEAAPIYSKLHKKKSGTPTMGGILIWFTILALAVIFYYLGKYTGVPFFHKLNFLTRSETLLPLGALVASALVGLLDDLFNIKSVGTKGIGGLTVKHRLLLYTIIAAFGAYWFFFKLDWDIIHVPFMGDFAIGWWYIPIFIFVIVATSFSVNETDGLDGLAGGVLLSSFGAFAAIALILGKMNLAAFCTVIVGSLLAFLWFNIPPARFFMGDTGAMALGTTLGIVAMLTNSAFILPIIGFILVVESFSVIVQIGSKKLRKGKKVFISAPIHHHLEAIGWPESKIVMRFWIISAVMAVLGIIVVLIDRSQI